MVSNVFDLGNLRSKIVKNTINSIRNKLRTFVTLLETMWAFF